MKDITRDGDLSRGCLQKSSSGRIRRAGEPLWPQRFVDGECAARCTMVDARRRGLCTQTNATFHGVELSAIGGRDPAFVIPRQADVLVAHA